MTIANSTNNIITNMDTKPAKKSVRFGVVRVLDFRVGYSSCTAPSLGGPPVGLIGAPVKETVYEIPTDEETIEEEDRMPRGDINDVWMCPLERTQRLMAMYNFSAEDIGLICREVRAIQDSRALSLRDFDPAYALHISQLELLRELRYTSTEPVHSPRQKVTLFDCNPVVGIVA